MKYYNTPPSPTAQPTIQGINNRILVIKATLIKATVIYLAGILIWGGIYYFTDQSAQNIANNKISLEQEINDTKHNAITLEQKAHEVREAAKLWEVLNQHNKTRNGLEIDRAKRLLNDLKKRYHILEAMSVDLSPPVELTDIYKTDTTVVMSSNVAVSFAGITDEFILLFIDTLIKNFPGFVNLQEMILEKKGEIDNDSLQQIQHGNLPDLVDASIRFQWRDFKDINNNPTADQNPKQR